MGGNGKDYLVDDKLTAEIHVKVKKTTGIYKGNLRNFDKTMEEFSDVVLVVNDEKFYVLKKVSRFLFEQVSYVHEIPSRSIEETLSQ